MKRKTEEEIKNELKIKNPTILLAGPYLGMNKKTLFQCIKHNKYWKTTPDKPLSGCGCSDCKAEKIGNAYRKTHESFIKEMAIVNPNIEICSQYITSQTKIKCKCKICGHIWWTKPAHLSAGHGCPQCGFNKIGDERRKSTEDFIAELYKINPYIEIFSDYKTCRDKIQCKCKLCGYQWMGTPSHLLQGEGCPACTKSSGERKIQEYLDVHHIPYDKTYTFDDLIGLGGRRLSYDFNLVLHNTLIEFQGKQHYQPIDFFGGKEQFEIQQEHDRRKKTYALSHGYNFLEIKYEDKECIDEILDEFFNNLKLETVETTGVV